MEYLVVILLAIAVQFGFNVISDKIDYQYSKISKVLAIAINAVLWVLCFNRFGFSPTFGVIALAETILISSSFIDLKYQEIPNSYNLALTLLGGVFIYLYSPHYKELIIGGAIAFAIFFIIMTFTGALGGGDVKMAGAIGLFMGKGLAINFISYSFLMGSVIAIILLLLKKKERKDVFPFGPCIALSAIYMFITLF